jgi:hypothetical protein
MCSAAASNARNPLSASGRLIYHEILSCEPDPSNKGFSRKLRDCSRPREFASRRINDRPDNERTRRQGRQKGRQVMSDRMRALAVGLLAISWTTLGPDAALAKDFREDRPPPASLQCPNDIIVPGMTWYGHTIDGKYLCKRDADLEGDRPTRNGQ